MYLMLKDTPVLEFDIDKNEYNILQSEKIPYRMRDCFWQEDSVNAKIHNYNILIDYLASRMLDISRKNSKKILNAYHLTQSQSPIDKAKIAITCRAVSATDAYWIALPEDLTKIKWKDIDPKHNSLNEIITHVALSGSSLTLTGIPHTPELTNHGSYAKAWIREQDALYLYKKDTTGHKESEIEVCVSQILSCTNTDFVKYEYAKFDNLDDFCKCKNMCTDELDMLTAEDFFTYCNRHELDFIQESLKIDKESIYKMCIMDYLLSNPDRHMQNWGFYVNNETGHILCCHPLFDHNNAFDESTMDLSDGGGSLIFQDKSKQEVALYCIKHCDFAIIKEIQRNMFPSDKAYQSFISRAKELKLCSEHKPTFKEKILRNYSLYDWNLGTLTKTDYNFLLKQDNHTPFAETIDKWSKLDNTTEIVHNEDKAVNILL